MVAVGLDGLLVEHIKDEFRQDKDISIQAITQNGLALKHIAKPFRNDKSIVLLACKDNPLAIKYASDNLKVNLLILEFL